MSLAQIRRQRRADLRREGHERHRSRARPRPPQHLAVAMLAQHIGMHRLRRDPEMQPDQRRGTARCRGSSPSRSPARRPSPESRTVTWVMMSTGFDATSRIASGATAITAPMTSRNTSALRPSRSSRLSPGFWLTPGGDDHHCRTGQIVIVAMLHDGRRGEGHRMGNVERLRPRQRRIPIDQHDRAHHAAQPDRIGRGTADHPRSDDPDLHLRSPCKPRSCGQLAPLEAPTITHRAAITTGASSAPAAARTG